MSELAAELARALGPACRTARGRRAVSGHDEDYQFDIPDEPRFHVAIRAGVAAVREGPTAQRGPLTFSRLEMSAATLRAILSGETTPVEAMSRGELLLRTRLYGGGQMTTLLREIHDLARAQASTTASDTH